MTQIHANVVVCAKDAMDLSAMKNTPVSAKLTPRTLSSRVKIVTFWIARPDSSRAVLVVNRCVNLRQKNLSVENLILAKTAVFASRTKTTSETREIMNLNRCRYRMVAVARIF